MCNLSLVFVWLSLRLHWIIRWCSLTRRYDLIGVWLWGWMCGITPQYFRSWQGLFQPPILLNCLRHDNNPFPHLYGTAATPSEWSFWLDCFQTGETLLCQDYTNVEGVLGGVCRKNMYVCGPGYIEMSDFVLYSDFKPVFLQFNPFNHQQFFIPLSPPLSHFSHLPFIRSCSQGLFSKV